ncbi:hypothetical protein ACPUVO_15620 [Pseudocolwellia sp. HL-MZ19]|uniref:hypothetical protein n=1 Tax=Pseudocolwellia sp. HL-MZ19 TaxID=3400846 RepID=UPI003CF46DEB
MLITNEIFSVLGLIVSVCTLCVAQQALGTWRNQFKHQEQHRSLLNAEECFKKYCASEEKLRVECIKMRSKQGVDFIFPIGDADLRNIKQREYQRSLDELVITYPKFVRKNVSLAPDELSKLYIETIREIHSDTFNPCNSNFYNMHEYNLKRGVAAFHKYRAKLS